MDRSGPIPTQVGFRASQAPALAAGTVVAQTYSIRAEIARTETGVVFEARDMLLDRLVAFKLAWRDPGTPSLILEARRCGSVCDPCAVQVHGMGRHDDVEFVVGERVNGRLLRADLTKALPGDVYLARLRRLIAAVARAHEGGIAVGDISGSTVLVVADGGVPEALRTGAEDRLVLGRLSLSQVPAFGPHGTVLAPEIVRGEVQPGDAAAAEAIDLYGLGCVAIELASGASPFSDTDRETEARGHANDPPPRISDLRPDLPGELSDLVDWLLAKQPAGRPRSARDVLAQVDAVIERIGTAQRALRVLIVDDDAARARWLWGLARRAHAAAIVETASEGTDAAHKLNRDQPDLVFIDASLRGVMNAFELCSYARGLESWHHALGQMFLIGDVAPNDAELFDEIGVRRIPEDAGLPGAILDRIRGAVTGQKRTRKPRSTVSG